jgi:hypothetical protein
MVTFFDDHKYNLVHWVTKEKLWFIIRINGGFQPEVSSLFKASTSSYLRQQAPSVGELHHGLAL